MKKIFIDKFGDKLIITKDEDLNVTIKSDKITLNKEEVEELIEFLKSEYKDKPKSRATAFNWTDKN